MQAGGGMKLESKKRVDPTESVVARSACAMGQGRSVMRTKRLSAWSVVHRAIPASTSAPDEEPGGHSTPALLPRRLAAYVRQQPLSRTVIPTAADAPSGCPPLVPRSQMLAWASRVESLRAAP